MTYGSFTLPNGVRVIYYNDNTRETSYAELIVDYGSLNKSFEIEGKTYEIKDGTAHFLEHLTIEHCKIGNLLKHYKYNSVTFNGFTSNLNTRFYIDTVSDFEKHLETLICNINDADFTEDDILATKGPIIEEARTAYNRPFFKLEEEYNSNYYNPLFYSIIGSLDDINNVDYDYLKRIYDTYYVPSNEIILLGGKFDLESCKKLIINAYQKINRKYILNANKKRLNIPNIINKNISLVIPKEDDYTEVVFKIDIKDLKPLEKLKLDYYYHYIIDMLFDDRSKLFKHLTDNKYTFYSIERSCQLIDNMLYLKIGCYTKEDEIFISKVLEEINNYKVNQKDFKTFINSTIISTLLKKESYKSSLYNYANNILTFETDLIEDAAFISALNINEMYSLVEKLDFSNYGVIKQRKE